MRDYERRYAETRFIRYRYTVSDATYKETNRVTYYRMKDARGSISLALRFVFLVNITVTLDSS